MLSQSRAEYLTLLLASSCMLGCQLAMRSTHPHDAGLPVADAQHTTTPILCLQRHAGAKLVGEWSRWDLTRDPKQVRGIRCMAGGSV